MLLNCKGKLLHFEEPLVMGILNITDNSFYKGYLGQTTGELVGKVANMLADGADIIDIGGQSTKPGSQPISASEEMERVLPVITAIRSTFPEAIISIDTFYAEVAQAAVSAGARMVNDVSGGEWDEQMIPAVGKMDVPYICMHMKGKPATMQNNPDYDDLLVELTDYFHNKLRQCHNAGILDVIIDPGFGFGKTIHHNFWLLKNLSVFQLFNKIILAGLSRKSTVYKTLGIDVNEALNGSTVLHTIALMNGANMLRVHDVKEAKEAVKLFSAYKKAAN